MRYYHVKVTLLTLGVLLGFGGAIARYAYGHPIGPGCHGWHHGHHGHHHHHPCDGHDREAAPQNPSGVQSGQT